MSGEQQKIVCPNCGAQALKDGTKIVCEACDATYMFKKTGGAKVVDIGRLDSIEGRLVRVENLLPDQEPDPPNPDDPADPDDPPNPDDPADPADPQDPADPYNPNADNSILGPE